ncbi:MAG: hypothetical protein MK066_14370 [Crocinitomicaceae bacterium]|nr:hypothetical protein [Crocinitomicaceae bacterium]
MGNSISSIKILLVSLNFLVAICSFSQSNIRIDQNGISHNQELFILPLDSGQLHSKIGVSSMNTSTEYGTYYWHDQGLFATYLTETKKITGFGITFSKKHLKRKKEHGTRILLERTNRIFKGQLTLLNKSIDSKSLKKDFQNIGFTDAQLLEAIEKVLPFGTVRAYFRNNKLLGIFVEFA